MKNVKMRGTIEPDILVIPLNLDRGPFWGGKKKSPLASVPGGVEYRQKELGLGCLS